MLRRAQLTRRSEHVRQRGIHGDTACGDTALDVDEKVSRDIILIDRKGPGVSISAMIQLNFFTDLSRAERAIGAGIPTQPKVIERIVEASGLLPYPQTEIAALDLMLPSLVIG